MTMQVTVLWEISFIFLEPVWAVPKLYYGPERPENSTNSTLIIWIAKYQYIYWFTEQIWNMSISLENSYW